MPLLIIFNGIDDNLSTYDLAGKLDIRLGSADNLTFFVYISILLFRGEVNTSDDIPLAVVGVKTPLPTGRGENPFCCEYSIEVYKSVQNLYAKDFF